VTSPSSPPRGAASSASTTRSMAMRRKASPLSRSACASSGT
jgi:hypothetical protein